MPRGSEPGHRALEKTQQKDISGWCIFLLASRV
jgi:hypothetical protein